MYHLPFCLGTARQGSLWWKIAGYITLFTFFRSRSHSSSPVCTWRSSCTVILSVRMIPKCQQLSQCLYKQHHTYQSAWVNGVLIFLHRWTQSSFNFNPLACGQFNLEMICSYLFLKPFLFIYFFLFLKKKYRYALLPPPASIYLILENLLATSAPQGAENSPSISDCIMASNGAFCLTHNKCNAICLQTLSPQCLLIQSKL